jgi:hypothetical protein
VNAEAFAAALGALETLAMPEDACEQRLAIAGLHLCVRLSTPQLAESALRALAHHAVADDTDDPAPAPDLTVLVLDRDAPGHPLRELFPAATSAPPMGDRVERWCYEGASRRGLLHEGFRTLFLWDGEHARAAVWLGEWGEERALPYHLVALPLLPILSWAFAARGFAVVHAAAVATESGAVLIGGRSGTGKSTTALACLDAGLGFLGDDMCVIEPGDPPIVHSLFCSAKIDAPDIARFPALSPALVEGSGPGWEKSVYLFDRHLERRVVRAAPLAGVAIPRRDTGPALLLSPRQGFLAMAPNTAFQLPGAAQASIAGVKEIVSKVPVVSVGVGETIAAIPGRVRDFARPLAPAPMAPAGASLPGARAEHLA